MSLPAQPNRSLMDGLVCLQALAIHPEPIGSRELARQLGLEPTRVNRLLRTLASMGLTEQDENRKYRPGPAIHALAAQSLFGSGLVNRAVRYLPPLLKHGYIVALGVVWRDQTSYLYHVNPQNPADRSIVQRRAYPAAVSGVGLVQLAQLSERHVRDLYEPTEPPLLPLSSEPPELDGDDGLLTKLKRIQEQGYALVRTEPGQRTLAVAVGDPCYCGVGVSGTFPDTEVDALKAALVDAAEKIAAPKEP